MRSSTASIVNDAGSMSSISSHASGTETGAFGRARVE